MHARQFMKRAKQDQLADLDERGSSPLHCIYKKTIPPQCTTPLVISSPLPLSYPYGRNCDDDRNEYDNKVQESQASCNWLVNV